MNESESAGNFDQGIEFGKNALPIAKKLQFKISALFSGIGNIYRLKGDYLKSLEYHFNALKIDESLINSTSIQSKKSISKRLGNIGNVYKDQGNYDKALMYYLKSLKIANEINFQTGIAICYGNIGTIYLNQKKYEEALAAYFNTLSMCEKLNNKNEIARTLGNISNVYISTKDYNKALDYGNRALTVAKEIEDKTKISAILGNIGEVYFKTNKFNEAKKHLIEAIAISNKVGYKGGMVHQHQMLSNVFDKLNEHKLAFIHYKTFTSYRDSLRSEENTKKQTQLEMQYEFDKQHDADSIKNVEKAKQELFKHGQEIKQQKIYTYGGVIGFSLMLIVAFVSFRAFQNKKKANTIIAEQKLLVEMKQSEIIDSIKYASRIQKALLPSNNYIRNEIKRLYGEK